MLRLLLLHEFYVLIEHRSTHLGMLRLDVQQIQVERPEEEQHLKCNFHISLVEWIKLELGD